MARRRLVAAATPVCVLALLAATQPTLAGPSMRLGARMTAYEQNAYVALLNPDGSEKLRITHQDAYWGPGVEAVYGPISWVYGRIELAGVRFFHAGGGALVAFPTSGLDILVEPPLRWRWLPYLWVGWYYSGYWGSQGTPDPRFSQSDVGKITPIDNMRVGLGFRYEVSGRLSLFAETQLWDRMTALTYWPPPLPQAIVVEGSGPLLSGNVGVRYNFGAK